jgi:hypothetical protein
MAYEIRSIEKDRGNSYAIKYTGVDGSRETLTLYATDELGAYAEACKILERKKKNMKTFSICVTLAFVASLTSAVAGCKITRAEYATNMATCLKTGKSYVAEGNGYSCRDIIVRRKTNG